MPQAHRLIPARRTPLAFAGVTLTAIAFAIAASTGASDRTEQSAQPEGLHEHPPGVHALVNAKVVVSPGSVLDGATIIVRNGSIEAVGADVKPPADARVWDYTGRTIYPGLIDAYSELTESAVGEPAAPSSGPELLRSTSTPAPATPPGGAPYWNPRVTPQFNAADSYRPNADENRKLRGQGIVARLVAPSRQIVKGTSAAIATGDGDGARSVLRPAVAMHVRLTPAQRSDDRVYPNSPMGAVALVRQSILDARWYAAARSAWEADRTLPRPEQNDALAAFVPAAEGKMPLYVDAPDELYALRAGLLAREFKLQSVVVRGSGQEYRRLSDIAADKLPIVVPVNFAGAPDVANPDQALGVSLDELMDWDLQPENPARLTKAGAKIALTSHGLRDKAAFLTAIRKAVHRGLSKESALRALTSQPAELLGLAATHGSIERGKSASFVVADGDLFSDKTVILDTWVDGKRYEVTPTLTPDPRGKWTVAWGEGAGRRELVLQITGTPAKLAGKLSPTSAATQPATSPAAAATTSTTSPATQASTRPADLDVSHLSASPGHLTFTFKYDRFGPDGVAQASLVQMGDVLAGRLVLPTGRTLALAGERLAAATVDESREKDDAADAATTRPTTAPATRPIRNDPATRPALYEVNYPLGAFGRPAVPDRPKRVIFQNGTVWTCGPRGKLAGASVLVEDGRIASVLPANAELPAAFADATIVDCAGRHLTPGIIDCHSHIATDGGVNESGRAVTCNVRIADFIDPDDIGIYRQLAGGVTASNILHGSANPIGGQNQVIKLRWGGGPEELKLDGAPPGVKFALGENVKQANWGERFTTRYPQTRLGVDQIIRDRFTAALAYNATHDAFRTGGKKGIPPRVDLEMEALHEIVTGKRLIHCHSYRQDEILAFLRVCEKFNVKVATLQHILEGYKVADAIAKHGAGASSFSDWWAYKFEVFDAIPYNGSIMRNVGVNVSFNSDDAELARRLNLEAAKAVKYGKVPEEEALKFVTLNPAKQLGIDQRVGSIETGKDADLVIWSGPPLSTLSRCEQTWIDGRRFFDRAEDQQMRQRDAERRAKLIQKVLSAGGATPSAGGGPREPRQRDLWAREDLYCGCNVEGGR